MYANKLESDDQPANVGPSGGDRRYGPAGEVAFFKAILGACPDAEFALPADLADLPRVICQWAQYATDLARWRCQYQSKKI